LMLAELGGVENALDMAGWLWMCNAWTMELARPTNARCNDVSAQTVFRFVAHLKRDGPETRESTVGYKHNYS
jgi:hypothetical protein